jgi:WD40 repeat protein
MRLPRAILSIRTLMIGVAVFAVLFSAAVDYVVRHRTFDLAIPGSRAVYRGTETETKSLTFSGDGSVLAAAGARGSIQLWHTNTTWPLADSRASGRVFFGMAISPDGQWMSVADAGEEQPNVRQSVLRLFRLNHGLLPLADAGSIQVRSDVDDSRLYSGRALAFSPDGQWLASGGLNTIEIRDRSTLRLANTLRGAFAIPALLVYSKDGQSLAVGSSDGAVALLDARDGAQKFVRGAISGSARNVNPGISGHGGVVTSLVFCRSETRLISLGTDNEIKVWDAGTGALLTQMRNGDRSGWGDRSSVIAVTPGENHLISASMTLDLRLWDLDTGELVNSGVIPPLPPDYYFSKLAISPDGSMLAAAIIAPNQDSRIILWDIQTIFRISPPPSSSSRTKR